jgi:NAD(P)-dependent dehydrogenase (short-subunit alcohol dehydrogenase family)
MRAVVITGASTGIGRACALTLASRGFQVFAGVRKEEDGRDLRRAAAFGLLTPVHLDVTDAASIAAVTQQVAAEVGDQSGLSGLVNNAGTTLPCPVEFLPLSGFRHQLEVNLTGPLAVTQSLLPLLRRAQGRVVNVTSLGGRFGTPLMAPYAAAKHGLEGLSDVMRLEFGRLGVHVSIIEPGYVSTAMRGKLERDTEETIRSLPDEARSRYAEPLATLAATISQHAAHGSPPEEVANAVHHALTSRTPRTRYPVGKGAKRLLFIRRVLTDRGFDRLILRMTGMGTR